jgi:hypothetical protein
MERLSRNIDFLRQVKKSSSGRRRKILGQSTQDQVKAICDICYGILADKIKLSKAEKRKLAKRADFIRVLGTKSSKVPLRLKKRLLVQDGGIIPALLAPILAVAATLLSDLVAR